MRGHSRPIRRFADAFAAEAVILEVNEAIPPATEDYVTRFRDALLRLVGHKPLLDARH